MLCAGERSFEVKTEADSNDITEHPHDDKSRPYVCTVCDKRFTMKQNLTRHHKERHIGEMQTEADSNDITEHPHDDKLRPYVCTVCDKRFTTKGNMTEHRKKTHWRKRVFMYSV